MFSIFNTFKVHFSTYKWRLIAATTCMVFVDLLMYLIPFGIAYCTDRIYPSIIDGGSLRSLYILIAILVAVGFVRGLMANLMIRNYWHAAECIVRDIRNALYEKLQHLDINFYDNANTGDLMSRATYDIQLIRNFISYGIEHRLRIILISITIFAIMVYQEWRLALVVYLFLPMVFVIIQLFSKKMRSSVDKRQVQMGKLNSRVQENIAGIRVVKAFAMETHEQEKFDVENRSMRNCDSVVAFLQVHLNAILLVADSLGALIILSYGGLQVINENMSLGQLLAFIGYLAVLGFPIRIMAFNTSVINQAKGASERVQEILNLSDQQRHNYGDKKEPIEGKLAFESVSFSYPKTNKILDEVSFTIKPGEHVALFGLTGAGKSTLISLIPRFNLPDQGAITLDDKPITQWDMHFLRSQIGTVLQETFLFNASIYENISFGKPGASLEEVMEAASHAKIHEFIDSLPQKYDTQIGEYGIGLSGGQRQRIAIARTLLQNPRILILDDCTSSLDAVTEKKIQKQLRKLMKGRSTIIIAQRISTLSLADRIIVLDKGKISAIDSHQGLLENNILYRSIFESQSAPAGLKQPREI